MAIDFTIPAEAQAVRERVRRWVKEECMPAEQRLLAGADYKTLLGELRKKARAQGLWPMRSYRWSSVRAIWVRCR
jgi:acyl-CoA dehydrogenase